MDILASDFKKAYRWVGCSSDFNGIITIHQINPWNISPTNKSMEYLSHRNFRSLWIPQIFVNTNSGIVATVVVNTTSGIIATIVVNTISGIIATVVVNTSSGITVTIHVEAVFYMQPTCQWTDSTVIFLNSCGYYCCCSRFESACRIAKKNKRVLLLELNEY